MSLRTKFIFYIIPLILFVSLSFLLFFINRSNSLIRDNLTDLGFYLARNLSYSSELAIASEDPVLLQPYLDGIFKEEDVVLVAVYNKKGYIITFGKKAEIEEEIPRDIKEILLREKSELKRTSYTEKGEEIYDFYSPVFISRLLTPKIETRELAGFIRIGLSLKKIKTQSRAILTLGLFITVLVILLGSGITFFLTGKMINPIKELIKGVEIIGKGNLGHRIKIKTGDELEELAESFNQMAESLKEFHTALEEAKTVLEIKIKARTKELEELTGSLEEQVKQKTKELQKKIQELEKFQKLAVGRELKMVELKKEIKKLKEELQKYAS